MSILRMPAIKAELGHRSHASVYNAQRDGLLPKMVKIGERAVGLPDYELKAINTARIAGKSKTEIRELVKTLHAKRVEVGSV